LLFKHSAASEVALGLFFQPDSQQLGVISVANLWDPKTRRYTVQRFHLDGRLAHTRVVPAPGNLFSAKPCPEQRKVLAGSLLPSQRPEILIWDLDTGELQRPESKTRPDHWFLDSAGKELAVSTDSPAAAPGIWHWECTIIDLQQKTPPRTFAGKGYPPVIFSPDLRSYLSSKRLSGSEESVVALVDLPTGKVIWEHPVRVGVRILHFAQNGKRVCLVGQNQVIYVYDCSTGAEVRVLRGHQREITCVALSPDGRWLASADLDHEIRVWAVDDETK
jgi:WD40 repeat protein